MSHPYGRLFLTCMVTLWSRFAVAQSFPASAEPASVSSSSPPVAGPRKSPQATPAAEAPATGAASEGTERKIHFDVSPEHARLEVEQMVLDGNEFERRWVSVCSSPCEATLRQGLKYRVGGRGVQSSRGFFVDEGSGPLRLHANLGSRGGFVTGIVLTSVGGGVAGLAMFVYVGSSSGPGTLKEESQNILLGTMLGGAAVLAIGAALMVTNRTSIEIVPEGGAAKSPLLPHGIKLTAQGLRF